MQGLSYLRMPCGQQGILVARDCQCESGEASGGCWLARWGRCHLLLPGEPGGRRSEGGRVELPGSSEEGGRPRDEGRGCPIQALDGRNHTSQSSPTQRDAHTMRHNHTRTTTPGQPHQLCHHTRATTHNLNHTDVQPHMPTEVLI